MSLPRNKHNKMKREKLLRIQILSGLYKRGYTWDDMQREVMVRLDKTGYSRATLRDDINTMLKEWRENRIENIDYAQQLQLERINDIRREAWDAYDKSKLDYDQKWMRKDGLPNPNKDEGTGYGDPRFLEIVRKCNQDEAKILGLNTPERRELTGKDGSALNPQIQVEIIDRREQVERNDEDSDN